MANKPKQIGTAGETAVKKVLVNYWAKADRIILKGNKDEGDIGHCGDFIFEVKAGKQAHQFGDKQLAEWMAEADVEAKNAGVRYGILVTARAGVGAPNAHRWWVHVHLLDLAQITGGHYRPGQFAVVRLELGTFLELLADHGYTDDALPSSTLVLEEELVGRP